MDVQQNDRVTEEQLVTGWRCDRLVAAGFPLSLAATLAADMRFDLHAMVELVKRGCPPPLVARILAPLEEHAVAA